MNEEDPGGWFEYFTAELAADERTRQKRKPTARDVIERYNRAHGQNPHITLKQVCAEMDVNYASIRALKSRYAKQKRPKR